MPDFQNDMLRFICETYGGEAIHEAWREFMLWDKAEPEFDADSPHLPLFTPWFFHSWTPDPEETCVTDPALMGVKPTEAYLADSSRRIDPLLRSYLESCTHSPFRFYEILTCDPGLGFRVRDVLTGAEFDVVEHSASLSLDPRQLIYAQLAEVGGTVMLEACPSLVLPPSEKLPVLLLREDILEEFPDVELMAELDDIDLRDVYLQISRRLLDPQPPQLLNTDGDPIELQHIFYEVESAQAAFDALKHLALDEHTTEDDLLSEAEYAPDGTLQRVGFGWARESQSDFPDPSDTLIAFIDIDGTRLTLQVNSVRRAQVVRETVEAAFGKKAVHRATGSDSTDELWRQARETGAPKPRPGTEALNELPEVQAALDTMMAQHYENWVTMELPALGYRTPLEAVETEGGREMVEVLVNGMEDPPRGRLRVSRTVIERLRERLGLTP